MSLIPTEDVTFIDLVGEAFLETRGAGLMLSPVDVELLRRYEAAGIPPAVLVRGILRAAERRRYHGKPPHLSLGALKRTLDAEVRRFQSGQVRGLAPPPSAELLDRLLALAREAPLPEERKAYRAAYRAACAGDPVREPAALAWLQALPRPVQRAVASELRRTLGARLANQPREEYREQLRNALVNDALERAELRL